MARENGLRRVEDSWEAKSYEPLRNIEEGEKR